MGLVQVRRWQANIHDMLRCILSTSPEGLDSYSDSINSKLSVYKNLKDAPMLLELAIWKSKIIEQLFNRDNGTLTVHMLKMHCRTDSEMIVTIIIPNVLSFLTDR
jgi:hypothetical protein